MGHNEENCWSKSASRDSDDTRFSQVALARSDSGKELGRTRTQDSRGRTEPIYAVQMSEHVSNTKRNADSDEITKR